MLSYNEITCYKRLTLSSYFQSIENKSPQFSENFQREHKLKLYTCTILNKTSRPTSRYNSKPGHLSVPSARPSFCLIFASMKSSNTRQWTFLHLSMMYLQLLDDNVAFRSRTSPSNLLLSVLPQACPNQRVLLQKALGLDHEVQKSKGAQEPL